MIEIIHVSRYSIIRNCWFCSTYISYFSRHSRMVFAKFRKVTETSRFVKIFIILLILCSIFFLIWNYKLIHCAYVIYKRITIFRKLNFLNDIYLIPFDQLSNSTQRFSSYYNGKEFKGLHFTIENVQLTASLLNFTINDRNGRALTDLDILKSDPVYVSGLSDNHVYEGLKMMQSIREVYKGKKKVVVYDLGLR